MKKKKSSKQDIGKKLKEIQKQKDEYLDSWKRERADFLNYKKEESERIAELLNYAGTGLVLKLLPLLDNFDLAEKNIPQGLKNDTHIKGLLQVKEQINNLLKIQNVKPIESLGSKFDPNLHEIIEAVDSKEHKSGIIIEEIQKGYKIGDKILRIAKVKVAK
jgi:molecular chaperone GrpE